MRKTLLLAALALGGAALALESPAPGDGLRTPNAGSNLLGGAQLRFTTLDKGARSCWDPPLGSPLDGPHLLGFRDEASWLDFWAQHACGKGIPAPPVRFSGRMAIAYIAGSGSGATTAGIKEILLDRARETIIVRVEQDRVPAATSDVLNPYHIVSCRNVPGTLTVRVETSWRFRTLDLGSISGYRYGDQSFGGEHMIARDDRRWLRLWDDHTSNQVPPPLPPDVEFPREMVLASFFGYWPTNGASIEVVRITRTWFGALRVEVRKRAEPGMLDVVTNPSHLVATPMWPGPVFFVERSQP